MTVPVVRAYQHAFHDNVEILPPIKVSCRLILTPSATVLLTENEKLLNFYDFLLFSLEQRNGTKGRRKRTGFDESHLKLIKMINAYSCYSTLSFRSRLGWERCARKQKRNFS